MTKYTKTKVEKIQQEKAVNLKETDPIKFYEQEGNRLSQTKQQYLNALNQIEISLAKIIGKIELLREQKAAQKPLVISGVGGKMPFNSSPEIRRPKL